MSAERQPLLLPQKSAPQGDETQKGEEVKADEEEHQEEGASVAAVDDPPLLLENVANALNVQRGHQDPSLRRRKQERRPQTGPLAPVMSQSPSTGTAVAPFGWIGFPVAGQLTWHGVARLSVFLLCLLSLEVLLTIVQVRGNTEEHYWTKVLSVFPYSTAVAWYFVGVVRLAARLSRSRPGSTLLETKQFSGPYIWNVTNAAGAVLALLSNASLWVLNIIGAADNNDSKDLLRTYPGGMFGLVFVCVASLVVVCFECLFVWGTWAVVNAGIDRLALLRDGLRQEDAGRRSCDGEDDQDARRKPALHNDPDVTGPDTTVEWLLKLQALEAPLRRALDDLMLIVSPMVAFKLWDFLNGFSYFLRLQSSVFGTINIVQSLLDLAYVGVVCFPFCLLAAAQGLLSDHIRFALVSMAATAGGDSTPPAAVAAMGLYAKEAIAPVRLLGVQLTFANGMTALASLFALTLLRAWTHTS
jgi:hypothetical protein